MSENLTQRTDLWAETAKLAARITALEERLARVAQILSIESDVLSSLVDKTIPPPRLLPPPLDPGWRRVLHTDPACLSVAYYLIRSFSPTEPAILAAMRVCPPPESQWRIPATSDVPVCSSCGHPIHPYGRRDLDFTQAFDPREGLPSNPGPPSSRLLPPDLVNPAYLRDSRPLIGPLDPRAFSEIHAMIERISAATDSTSPAHTQDPPKGQIQTRVTRHDGDVNRC